jgi:hypothetical protein
MDARVLLETVGDTYAKLASFEVEFVFTRESGDDDNSDRCSQRARAFFAAPDRVRIDQPGRRGILTVSNGTDIHYYFRGLSHYATWAVGPGHRLEGLFRPEHPAVGERTFLFSRIAERVVDAEILREEPGAHVVSVTYDAEPHPGFVFSCSPVTFWIDPQTTLVSRVEGEMTLRVPPDNHPNTSKNSCAYAHTFLNQPIPPQTFEFIPPADAADQTIRRPGSGSSNHGSDEKKRFATWHSADWEDEAFVDNFELKIRNLELNFERRLTFAGKDLRISEKIIGPQGPAEREFSIPVA